MKPEYCCSNAKHVISCEHGFLFRKHESNMVIGVAWQ
jgi:hypothetical protein